MMFHIVLAAFFRFKMEVSLGSFTLLLFVVSSFILDCFFN